LMVSQLLGKMARHYHSENPDWIVCIRGVNKDGSGAVHGNGHDTAFGQAVCLEADVEKTFCGRVEHIDVFAGPDPEQAFGIFLDMGDVRRVGERERVERLVGETSHGVAIVPVQSIQCPDPDEPLAVLVQGSDEPL